MLDWLKQKLIGSEGWRLWWWQWCIWSEIGWSYWPPASAKGTKLAEIKSAFSADSAVSARERLNICLLPPSDNTNSCFSSIDLPNSGIFDCGKKSFQCIQFFAFHAAGQYFGWYLIPGFASEPWPTLHQMCYCYINGGITYDMQHSCSTPLPSFVLVLFFKFTKFPDSFHWFYLLSFQQGAWKINMSAKFSLKAGRVWSPQASLGRSIMSPMKGGGGVSPHELWHVTRRLLKRRNWGGGSIYGGYDPCGVP